MTAYVGTKPNQIAPVTLTKTKKKEKQITQVEKRNGFLNFHFKIKLDSIQEILFIFYLHCIDIYDQENAVE